MIPNTGPIPGNGLLTSSNTLKALHSTYYNYGEGNPTSYDFRVSNLYQVTSTITVEEVAQYVGSYLALNTTEIWSVLRGEGLPASNPDSLSPYYENRLLASYPHSSFIGSYRDGDYLYIPVQPLVLTPGFYAIGAASFGGQGFLRFNAGPRTIITDNGNGSIWFVNVLFSSYYYNYSSIGSRYGSDNYPTLLASIRYSLGDTTGSSGIVGPTTHTAYVVPGGTPGTQSHPYVLGMDFDVSQPVTVTELGVFDSGGNGINGPLYCEIWTRNGSGPTASTGVRLAIQTFTSSSMGTLVGGTRFKPITPLVLAPGSYTVVSYGYSDADQDGNTNYQPKVWFNDGASGAITFGGSRYTADATGNGTSIGDRWDVNASYAAGSFRYYVN